MKSLKNEGKKSLISRVNERGLHLVVDRLLKQDKRLWTADGKLIENKLIEFVQKDDENIIKLLLSEPLTKDTFFQKISSVSIFKKDDFLAFKTMGEFLDGSYTAYSKHIGLANNFSSIKNASEVVLDFPYKDCVLEGGQEKGNEGRDEIFYNKILAKEEINRLEEEKVFTNWVKYTESGKEKVNSFDHKKDNLIIRGNNLLALYSLLPRYRGQIKLIYIDPPYNTGSDDFRYNDNFNHSSWLVFMKNRLEVAKKLLRDDGIIFIQCDDNEQAYLKVLMDEIFFKDNFLNQITWERSAVAGLGLGGSFAVNVSEWILVYSKDIKKLKINDDFVFEKKYSIEKIKGYSKILKNVGNKKLIKEFLSKSNGEKVKIYKHSDYIIENININKLTQKEIKSIYIDNFESIFRTFLVQKENKFQHSLIAEMGDGFYSVEYTPSRGKNSGEKIFLYYSNKELLGFLKENSKIEEGEIIKLEKPSDFWTREDISNASRGEGEIKGLDRMKKPEKLIQRIIEWTTNEDDIVLDYHLGSGTTGAVSHKIGRRYIGIEQLNYGETDAVVRLQNVIKGDTTGISKSVGWKGGGSFVYAELAEWNKKYIQEVEEAKTTKDLIKIYEKMSREAFFVYTFDQSKWDNSKFEELSFENQKKIILEILNMNHLYVNYKDIEDTTFKVSKEDIELNKKFYE